MRSALFKLTCGSLGRFRQAASLRCPNISRKHGIVSKHVGMLMPSLLAVQLGVFGNSAADARVTMYIICLKATDMRNSV
jgi:hypothetical protein